MFRSTEARPTCETDRGTASAARLLLLVVGMCAHSVEAQSTLVTEVKSALARTVALPEAHTSKHARIQALAALVSHLAELASPSAAQQDPNRSALSLSLVASIYAVQFWRQHTSDLLKRIRCLHLSALSAHLAGSTMQNYADASEFYR